MTGLKFFLIAVVFAVSPDMIQAQSTGKKVSIRIVQDASVSLNPYESAITLKKKSFKILVMLQNIVGVYVFAAFSDSICCRLGELDTIPGFADIPGKAIEETRFNNEKELLVNDDNGCSYWFYDKELSWHRFNRKLVFLDSSRVVGVKTVKQLFHLPTGKEIRMKDVDEPLYLFFVAISDFDDSGKPIKELMRRKVRINWEEDD